MFHRATRDWFVQRFIATVSVVIDQKAAGSAGPTADRLADALRASLIRGDLPPGTPLRDAAIAARFNVSRNTVREALRLLRAEGLAVHKMHKGTIVRRFDEADVRDMYVVRRTIELRAVEESAFAGPDQLAKLSESVAASEDALAVEDYQALGTASLEFHRNLVSLLGSPTLDEFFEGVLARLRLAFSTADEATFQSPWVKRDREINELVQSGQRDLAAAALRAYLDDSEAQVIDFIRQHPAATRSRRRPAPTQSAPTQKESS